MNKYIIHLDQKASQADIYKRNNYKPRSIIFKMLQNMNPKHLANNHLGITAFLLVTYIYIESVSLDTQ